MVWRIVLLAAICTIMPNPVTSISSKESQSILDTANPIRPNPNRIVEKLELLYNSGNLPEGSLLSARYSRTQARLEVARLEALATLIAAVPLEKLTVSLGV